MMIRIWTALALLAGIAAAIALVFVLGYEAVLANVASIGWGVLLLPVAFLPGLLLAALSWQLLFRPGKAPTVAAALYGKWIASSVNALLPLAGLSGDIVRLRLLMQSGTSGADAGASIIVEKTVEAVTVVLWALVGIAFLVGFQADRTLIVGALSAAALLTLGILGFIAVQHRGMFSFLAGRFGGKRGSRLRATLADGAAGLDTVTRGLYEHRGRLALATGLRFLARAAQTLEVWLVFALMGQAIGPWEAIMLKSLTASLRNAAFFVPGGWGVQEAAFLILGTAVGFSSEVMLAVALAVRARELLVAAPGLLAWQVSEGRHFRKRLTS